MTKAIMIAAPYSGSGKTTIVAGLLYALKQKGFQVQSFKVGPDYIDPSYHTQITGRPCSNLDLFLMEEEAVRASFFLNSVNSDISVIEGVMGLFDGMNYTSYGSSAHIARLLSVPVLLVWPCRGLSNTIIPLLNGLKSADPEVKITGLILNQVNSLAHYERMKKMIEEGTGVKVVGYLPKKQEFQIKERHLGLVPAVENQSFITNAIRVGEHLAETLDWTVLFKLLEPITPYKKLVPSKSYNFSQLTIAYAFDEAFNFYYHDVLDLLRNWQVKLVKTSPLHDQALPENIDGLILGGGFPELFDELLKGNMKYITSLRSMAKTGLPIYAECGGYMYLAMVNIIPAEEIMTDKLVALGYFEGKTCRDSIIAPAHTKVRGHQFHYSKVNPISDNYPWAIKIGKPNQPFINQDGYIDKNIFATYLHLHWIGQPELATNFLTSCLNWKRSRPQ